MDLVTSAAGPMRWGFVTHQFIDFLQFVMSSVNTFVDEMLGM